MHLPHPSSVPPRKDRSVHPITTLLIPDRRLARLTRLHSAPFNLPLLIERSLLIRHGEPRNPPHRLRTLPRRDAHLVPDDPQHGHLRRNSWVEESALGHVFGQRRLRLVVELLELEGEVRGRGVRWVDDVLEEGGEAGGGRGPGGGRGLRGAGFLRLGGVGRAALELVGRGRCWDGVGVSDAGFVVGEGFAHGEVEEDGAGEEDAFDGEGPDGGVAVGDGDGEEPDEADFREVDARRELLQGALVGGAARVEVDFVRVEEVVAEGEVDEREADGAEAEDEGGDAGVAEGDDAQVHPLGELGSPHGGGQLGELLEDLAGRLAGEDAAEQDDGDEAANIEERACKGRKTEENEIVDIEIGRLWQVLREQSDDHRGIVENLLDDSGDGSGHSGDEEDLDDLERKVPRLCLEFDLRESNPARQLSHHYHN